MIRRVAVVVPAADEESSIDRCLAALCDAAARVAVPVRIIVVLDACTDATADVVRRRPDVEAVTTSARNVGRARRVGAAHALLGEDPRAVWLANTDADSQVPLNWLSTMLELAEPAGAGTAADVVLGTVVPDSGLLPTIERSWFAEHVQSDGHPHVHGANFGIRGDAYLALGGWRSLAVHEDADLATRAERAGMTICRTARIPVRTSTRTVGRTPSGFSSYLRTLGHA